jgi:hypothetical protein
MACPLPQSREANRFRAADEIRPVQVRTRARQPDEEHAVAAHREPSGVTRLPPQLTLHIGAARAVARARMLGSRFARLSLDHALPLHVGDRVLLRDPGAARGRGYWPACRQPYTTAEAARLALATTRPVVITLLEWLDRQGVTLRLADDRRIVRQQPGSP